MTMPDAQTGRWEHGFSAKRRPSAAKPQNQRVWWEFNRYDWITTLYVSHMHIHVLALLLISNAQVYTLRAIPLYAPTNFAVCLCLTITCLLRRNNPCPTDADSVYSIQDARCTIYIVYRALTCEYAYMMQWFWLWPITANQHGWKRKGKSEGSHRSRQEPRDKSCSSTCNTQRIQGFCVHEGLWHNIWGELWNRFPV